LGTAGIEPTLSESHVTGPLFRLNHLAKGEVQQSLTSTARAGIQVS
jgi:hypothetical protein